MDRVEGRGGPGPPQSKRRGRKADLCGRALQANKRDVAAMRPSAQMEKGDSRKSAPYLRPGLGTQPLLLR